MKLCVTYEDNFYSLDISEDSEVEILKALLEFESGLRSSEFALYHHGQHMREMTKTLGYYGVKDGDILVMNKRHTRPATESVSSTGSNLRGRSAHVPGTSLGQAALAGNNLLGNSDPIVLREMLLSDPYGRSLLKERNPPLSQALESGDPQKFVNVFNEQRKSREEQVALRRRMVQADPLDIEAQKKIAEEIQQENINSNMETAMEFSPESFGQVTMLYINCLVNGQPVKAFVDSGAQMTIMSVACAERCNIMRLVDRRWAGLAKGVGTQRIIGRVHVTQIQIEDVFLASSFSVLESQPMDMLLGLDMLKRHQCCIDLKENMLKIGTTNTRTPFLPESDLPECARLSSVNSNQQLEDEQLAEALKRSAQENVTTQSSEASTSTAISHLPPHVRETDIQRLLQLGFKREDIVKELQKNGGDMDKTTAVLLARSLKLPSK